MRTKLKVLMAQKEVDEGRPITQQVLADETGIPQSTISKLMNERIIRLETKTLLALCDYFHCDVGDLFFIDRKTA